MSKNDEILMAEFAAQNENFTMQPAKIEKIKPTKPSNIDIHNEAEQLRKEGKLDYLGWQPLEIESIPTRGMFYPEGTKIFVRAATGGEIKHWSTMNVEDIVDVDEKLNYIIEKCCKISIPGTDYSGGSWKDLIDVDRLYILLAIRDFTWPVGDNELKIPISETNDLVISKDNINFVEFPDEIMKYYNEEERCFKLKFKNGKTINMYMTSLGVSNWLKSYVQQKQNSKEQFDKDFLLYAPLLIKNHRKITNNAYEALVENSNSWSIGEWSAIGYFRDNLLKQISEPELIYIDEAGLEQKIPLTFRGGIKTIFTVSNSLSFLD